MKKIVLASVGLAIGVVLAEPEISDLQLRQLPNRTVEVEYDLSEDGFVSVDFQTNGVSIGCANFANVTGDCNKVVSAGSCKISWKARNSWPNHREEMTVRLQAMATNATPDYLVVDLATGFRTYHATKEGWEPAFGDDVYKTEKLVMKRVHAAGVEWTMGIGTNLFGYAAKYQAHPVVLTHDYYLGVYELTQRQWEIVMAGNAKGIRTRPSFYSNEVYYATRPVESVAPNLDVVGSWMEMQKYPEQVDPVGGGSFLATLRARTGLPFTLPTGAQWEYACRAGSRSSSYNGREYNVEAAETAIYGRCGQAAPTANDGLLTPTEGGTCAVGSFASNAWGFYDMYGNVKEMTLDWYYHAPVSPFFDYLNCLARGVAVDPRGLSWKEVSNAGTTLTSIQARGGHFVNTAGAIEMLSWYYEGLSETNWGGDIGKSYPMTGLRVAFEL